MCFVIVLVVDGWPFT